MEIYAKIQGGTLPELRDQVRRLEDLGVAGVMVTDHLFMAADRPRVEARRPPEPLTLLAAVAALSDRLKVGTIVSNAGLLHPALLLRQFAQIAVLIGGDRVLAGLGAGWNREEFDALGFSMPGFQARLDRLEEAAHLARQLFDRGLASLDGTRVVARDLPFAPLPPVPPRLLLGGGSDRLLEIAGRYADVLDLNGSSRQIPVSGANLPMADKQRRLATTVADLEISVEKLRAAAVAVGRPADAVQRTVLMDGVVFCPESEVAERSAAIAASLGQPPRNLNDSPYFLLGEAERMADRLVERRERLGLSGLVLADADAVRFCREVLPLLG